jgi:glycosyltransferase involved in cell wall biosynthesis
LDPDCYEVIVLVGGDGILVVKLKEKSIKTITLEDLVRDVSLFKDAISFWNILRVFAKEKPDIIHLNSSKMGMLGALAGRMLFVQKIIFTGHGWAFNEDRSRLQKNIIYLLHKFTIILSHITIAVSEDIKKQIGIKSKKIVVIRNGIEEIDFFNKEIAREKIFGKLTADLYIQDRLLIGTISELHKNKGLEYLIDAVNILKSRGLDENLPFVIIIGEGEERIRLQERINRYFLENNIFMIGRVDEAQKYLKAFDIFTLTSITESLSYVILEAGQAGLPVVASRVGGIPEIINNMESGILVESKKPEEIIKAVYFLLNNPEKMNLFGQNLQRKVSGDFSKEGMIKRILDVYEV